MDDQDVTFSLNTLHPNLPKAQPCLKYAPGPKLLRNPLWLLSFDMYYLSEIQAEQLIGYFLLVVGAINIFHAIELKRKKKLSVKTYNFKFSALNLLK